MKSSQFKLFAVLFLGLIFFSFTLQQPTDDSIQLTSEKIDGKVVYYASNSNYCPYTLNIDFPKLQNVKASVDLPFRTVVPAQTEKIKLFELTPKPNSATSYSISMGYSKGDFNAKHNDGVVYQLPYLKGTSHSVDQGYGGKFSHHMKGRKYALDFSMENGTDVYAARAGIVVETRSSDSKGGSHPSFQNSGNYITIYHEDGTFANYFHLKKGGVKVKNGETVEAGQLIGQSGNTGWSSGPHLHFEVFSYSGINEVTSVPVKFLVDGKAIELEEGKVYTNN